MSCPGIAHWWNWITLILFCLPARLRSILLLLLHFSLLFFGRCLETVPHLVDLLFYQLGVLIVFSFYCFQLAFLQSGNLSCEPFEPFDLHFQVLSQIKILLLGCSLFECFQLLQLADSGCIHFWGRLEVRTILDWREVILAIAVEADTDEPYLLEGVVLILVIIEEDQLDELRFHYRSIQLLQLPRSEVSVHVRIQGCPSELPPLIALSHFKVEL